MDKNLIYESVINELSTEMITKVSTVSVAKGAGISEAYLFKIFKTKVNLLTETFFYIDDMLVELGKKQLDDSIKVTDDSFVDFAKKIWISSLTFLYENPKYLNYFLEFESISNLYTNEIIERQRANHSIVSKYLYELDSVYNIFHKLNPDIFLGYVKDTTLIVAKRIKTGQIIVKEGTLDALFHVAFDGFLIRMGVMVCTKK